MKKHWFYRPIALFLAICMIGCGWKVVPLSRPEVPVAPKLITERVLLRVDDVGVIWGGGRLGEIVRETLITEGAFQDVYYPIEPMSPPTFRLVITATGDVDEEVGLGLVKSVITGMLFFLPVGIIRYNKDFNLDAEVVLFKANEELHRFQVNNSTNISHTMFSDITSYETKARLVAFKNLGQQIVAHLRRHGVTYTNLVNAQIM